MDKRLAPGEKLAQSCHVAFTFAKEHPEKTSKWMSESNYICILEATDENALIELIGKANTNFISCSVFREPDKDDAITAIALAPGKKSKKLCSRFPLALKDMI